MIRRQAWREEILEKMEVASVGEMEITVTTPTECEAMTTTTTTTTLPTTTPTEQEEVREVGVTGDPINNGCPTEAEA